MDYFQHFNLEPKFNLDLNELRKRFYQKSRELHPDINLDADTAGQDAIYLAALNNQAYQILLDPLSRLKYIIEISGGLLQDSPDTMSQDFLMEMLELHEIIFEARVSNEEAELTQLNKQLNELETAALDEAQDFINAFDQSRRSKEITNGLLQYYYKLKYFNRLRQTLEGHTAQL